MPVDLVGAAIGCMAQVFSDAGVELLRESADRRALRAAVKQAIESVVTRVEPDSRGQDWLRRSAHGSLSISTLVMGFRSMMRCVRRLPGASISWLGGSTRPAVASMREFARIQSG